MSIGWGFAYGAGKAAYSVADDRIKEGMLERRELRAREATMELEQYRTKTRREEKKEERSYLEGRSGVEQQQKIELQELKGKQAMALQKAKPGTTGAGKGFKPITIETDEGPKLFSFDNSTGSYIPYEGAGGGQISEADINSRTDEWAQLRFGKWASEEDMKAAAKEIGYKGELSREALRFAYKDFLRTGGQISPAATDIGSAPAAKEAKSPPPKVTEKDITEAAEAQKSPKALRAFMKKRGKTEEEIKQAEKEIFGGKGDAKKESTSVGTFTGMGGNQPVKQGVPKHEQYKMDAQEQFSGFAKLPEKQKYAVFRIYSPYWTEDQRKQAKQMMPKASAKQKSSSSYLGL